MNATRRRHRLKSLKITRVDLVDVPASFDRETGAGAFVKLWKRGRGENEDRTMELLDVQKRGAHGRTLDDVASVLRGLGALDVTGPDRAVLRTISKRAAALADPTESEPDERGADPYLGPVFKRGGDSRFETLVERIFKNERLSFVDALSRAAEIDPDACAEYQRRVRDGR